MFYQPEIASTKEVLKSWYPSCNRWIYPVPCTTIQRTTVSRGESEEKERGVKDLTLTVIELACGEYGYDKIDTLKSATENGSCLTWFNNPAAVLRAEALMRKHPIPKRTKNVSLENTSFTNQCSVLLRRGYIKARRDTTMTHLRIIVNIALAIVYGAMYDHSGSEGSRVLDNYNLLFAILMHHSMTTMMLTVLTCE